MPNRSKATRGTAQGPVGNPTQFARVKFLWIDRIARDHQLLAIDTRVAAALLHYFTASDNGGRAYPSCKTLGDAIGVSEATVIRSVNRLHDRGHLIVIWGKPGRGHPNQYWMAAGGKPASVQVLEAQKPARVAPRKPASDANKTFTGAGEPLFSQIPSGESYALPQTEGERERTSCDVSPSSVGDPPLTRDPDGQIGESKSETESPEAKRTPDEKNESAESAEDDAAERVWRELCALWRRGWQSDETAKAVAISKLAFAKACTLANPDEILAAAKTWIAAADAPRFLPALPQWLAARGWEKRPPPKNRPAYAGGHRNGTRQRKPDFASIGLDLAARYEAAERERERERRAGS
jgi:Helix-turn-helix domain